MEKKIIPIFKKEKSIEQEPQVKTEKGIGSPPPGKKVEKTPYEN